MRVGFAGTPDFAVRMLAAVHAAGYTIPVVLTQPDRPSGRGLALAPSAVKRYAQSHGLDVLQPATLRDEAIQMTLRDAELDVLVVAAYGLILPQAVLDAPRHGCFNVHASLLPRWRGAAPMVRAIEAGDRVTGITIMQMDAGLDTGPLLRRESVPIGPRDTAGTLHDRLAEVGARLLVETLDALRDDGGVPGTPQPAEGITYANKLGRVDRVLRWTRTAEAIDRQVRALSPVPGALATFHRASLRVVAAVPLDASPGALRATGEPGTVQAVTSAGVDVLCGSGTRLRLIDVQPASGRVMTASAFAAGRGVRAGSRFDAVDA